MFCLGTLVLLTLVVAIDTLGSDAVRPTFHPPLPSDASSTVCGAFTVGNWEQREFYSPSYPSHYPNKTDCIHLIIAPQGYRIRLDFKDDFHIEPSLNCEFDYVEFRDGPFGYSPLIGQYCGPVHPPMMESKSRFLWVHFRSDDSIEYKGFHAFYDFFTDTDGQLPPGEREEMWDFSIRPFEVCRIVVDVTQFDGTISTKDIPKDMVKEANDAELPLDCTWAFYAPRGHRIKLKFERLQTASDSCEDGFVEIYENSTASTDQMKQICNTPPGILDTSSQHAYIRAYGKLPSLVPQFAVFFTVFHPYLARDDSEEDPCPVGMFDCRDDSTCVNMSLLCNNRDNCPMKYDEEGCDMSTTVEPTRSPPVMHYHMIIIGIVGGAILTIIFLAIVVTCYQKSKEEARQRQALGLDERHAMEVEMTNLLNRSPQHGPGVIGGGAAVPGLNAHSAAVNPNGPVNHVGPSSASQSRSTPIGNHVGPSSPALKAHSQALGQNGHTSDPYPHRALMQEQVAEKYLHHDRPERPLVGGHMPTGSHVPYLGMQDKYPQQQQPVPGKDDTTDSKAHSRIPIVATIEKRPERTLTLTCRDPADMYRTGASARDRTPSPRPDIVQEEKFMRHDQPRAGREQEPPTTAGREQTMSRLPLARRMSNETERSDKSDVWKPMATHPPDPSAARAPLYERPQNPGPRSNVPPPNQYVWSAPQPRAMEAQYEPPSDYRQPGIGFEPIMSDPSYYAKTGTASSAPGYYRDDDAGGGSYRLPDYDMEPVRRRPAGPPMPPQRRTATLQHQTSAPVPPATDPVSPSLQRALYSRTPPPRRTPPAKSKVPQSKSSSSLMAGKSRAAPAEHSPSLFYSRPNPGRSEKDRAGSKQHHPV